MAGNSTKMAHPPLLTTGGYAPNPTTTSGGACSTTYVSDNTAVDHPLHPWQRWNINGPETMSPSLTQMIASRLRLHDGEHIGFDHIHAHQLAVDKFVVFLVHKGSALTIEDDALFPSDRLITQLRLLRG